MLYKVTITFRKVELLFGLYCFIYCNNILQVYNFIYFYLCTVNIIFPLNPYGHTRVCQFLFFIVLYYHTACEVNKEWGGINIRVYFQVTLFVNSYYKKRAVKVTSMTSTRHIHFRYYYWNDSWLSCYFATYQATLEQGVYKSPIKK